MRLDKFLSHSSFSSRKGAKKAVRHAVVKVNGVLVNDYKMEIRGTDVIELNGVILPNKPFSVYMINKPEGYMCSMIDERYSSVMNLFPEHFRKTLRMVGRLDQDTTGLLLLTDNGKLNQRLMSPKSEINKTYFVEVNHLLRPTLPDLCNKELDIGRGEIAKPSKVEILDEYHALITISEGKYHEVKRIFGHFSYDVIKLKRLSLGPVELGDLKEGEYRELTHEEVDALLKAARLEKTEQL